MARGRENNRYRETANGSSTVTYIYAHAHETLLHAYRNTAAREYKRVLAPGTPITPHHDVDTILRRPEKFLQSGGKKTISLLPRNSSKN